MNHHIDRLAPDARPSRCGKSICTEPPSAPIDTTQSRKLGWFFVSGLNMTEYQCAVPVVPFRSAGTGQHKERPTTPQSEWRASTRKAFVILPRSRRGQCLVMLGYCPRMLAIIFWNAFLRTAGSPHLRRPTPASLQSPHTLGRRSLQVSHRCSLQVDCSQEQRLYLAYGCW